MVVKIRLARAGAKKKPYYRVVVANSNAPRDGKFLEKVGTYNPMLPKEDENRVIIDQEKIKYWLSVGAQPTDRVAKFLEKAKLIKAKTIRRIVKTEKSQDVANKPSDNEVNDDKSINQTTEKIEESTKK